MKKKKKSKKANGVVKKKKSKRTTKRNRKPLEIPDDTPSLEIVINEEGMIGSIRSTHSFAFRIVDLSLLDERTNEPFVVGWGYTKEGGEAVIPQYDPAYLKMYGGE